MGKGPGCILCGHQCRVDRQAGRTGKCGAGTGIGFSSALIHRGEEPPLSGPPADASGDAVPDRGPGGSGTIFFTRCNLRCVFCQNWQISTSNDLGRDLDVDQLVEVMFALEQSGAHNINLVSPTPYAIEIALALSKARTRGLGLPVVYNSGGYDSLNCLAMMDGLVDVYLPDAKIGLSFGRDPDEPDSLSMRLFGAGDYVGHNRRALLEMKRQVGDLVCDERGLAYRGLIVRHLVLPDDIARTAALLRWLAENLGTGLFLSLMAQYHPSHLVRAGHNPEFRDLPGLGRPLSFREYENSLEQVVSLGLRNAFVQDLEAAVNMVPDFTKPAVFH
ncbi:MAG: radical SAM protein [Deltaproteobacteria bacterium]|nr:radical SAM protein [Deltaproteobacteria bacterium]